MNINKNKSKREREGGGSNGFCPLLSLSISPIHAGIALISIHISMRRSRVGWGFFKFLIYTYSKIAENRPWTSGKISGSAHV